MLSPLSVTAKVPRKFMTERETLIWIQGYLEGKTFLTDKDTNVVSIKISKALNPKFKLDLDEINSWKKSQTDRTTSPYKGFPYGEVMCAAYNPEDHF